MKILKNFAVFEGLDGAGTTTQLNILKSFFLQNQLSLPPFYTTFEPTDGCIGKLIRSGLRENAVFDPKTLALLFAADRNEHIFGPEGIKKRCEAGELVVCDRYVPSSLVYQGITCGDEFPAILNKDFPGPELLIFFDIDPETAQKRMTGRGKKEIYENLNFQLQVRRHYKNILPKFAEQGVRVEILDGSLAPEEVSKKVLDLIKKMPIFEL